MHPARSSIAEEYEQRRLRADTQYARYSKRASLLMALLAIGALLVVRLAWTALLTHRNIWLAVGATCAELALLAIRLWLRSKMFHLARVADFYQRALGRVSGDAPQSGHTGAAFSTPEHLYEHDLNVFGENSLFGMLATTRTGIGQRALAQFLLQPVEADAVRQRQRAVQELSDHLDLRERVALLGRWSFQTLRAQSFDHWLDMEPAAFSPWLRLALPLLTLAWIGCGVYGLIAHISWDILKLNLLLLLSFQAALCVRLRPRVNAELEEAVKLLTETQVLREGLQVLRSMSFQTERLQLLQRELDGERGALATLGHLLTMLEQRNRDAIFTFGLLLGLGTELALWLAVWKQRHGAAMRRWLAAWAEFEALLAIATYAAEHAENVYPEIIDTNAERSAVLVLQNAKHPLLDPDQAVGNTVALGADAGTLDGAQFLLISGSNMAGKSTLLRTMGANAVLALAGAPIPATGGRMNALQIVVSLALHDSLAEGKSKFLAEVERLRSMVERARQHRGAVLFLIDEILSGTNSLDRRVAAEPVLRALVATGAAGAISTHDLTLTEIATLPGLHGRNVHMASPSEDDPLAFDYLLKAGVNQTTNALAITRMLGLTD